ncbi:MAG: hypothetical protein H6807_00040 [Planctomycetes bacterium]|nr:hypothetical protein [Planctomycetota bacterium]
MAASEPRLPPNVVDDRELDRLAGELATTDDGARRHFGAAVLGLLGHRSDTMKSLQRALAADPCLAAARIVEGFGLRVLGRRDLLPRIRATITAARAPGFGRLGDRERLLLRALEDWIDGRADRAADGLESGLRARPDDALLMKLVHALRFIIGDSEGMLRAAELAVTALAPEGLAGGFGRGCLSFALEENGRYDQAEEEGRRALRINPRDAWALHSVAHVLYERGEFERGATWLAHREEEMEGVNNFAGHVAWHEALFLIEAGAADRALEIHDRRVAVYPPNDYRDVSNASTLLLLLESHGVEVGDRWQWLAEIARARLGDHGLAFADIHYVLALAGAGHEDEAAAFVASMKEAARQRHSDFDAAVLLDVGAPLADAILDVRHGRLERARAAVRRLGREVGRMGGSRAQRRVIPWVLESALGARAIRGGEA